jgi:hypothetical protein
VPNLFGYAVWRIESVGSSEPLLDDVGGYAGQNSLHAEFAERTQSSQRTEQLAQDGHVAALEHWGVSVQSTELN